jgi:hypothetical protein
MQEVLPGVDNDDSEEELQPGNNQPVDGFRDQHLPGRERWHDLTLPIQGDQLHQPRIFTA